MHHQLLNLVLFATVMTPVVAQRTTAEMKWKKHDIALEYGAVNVGKHELSSLPVGQDWRMGMNVASQLRIDVPMFAGDAIVSPGSYRVKIYRQAEEELQLLVEGAGLAIGATQPNVRFPGAMSEPKKPSKKLEVSFGKPKGKPVCENSLEIKFGKTTFDVPFKAVAPIAKKGKAFHARVFQWPTETLVARSKEGLPTPVASIARKKAKKDQVEHYNVVLEGDQARLVPCMAAPTASFGFGEVIPPAKDAIIEGTVQWADRDAEAKAPATLELESFTDSQNQVTLAVVIGERVATLSFEL